MLHKFYLDAFNFFCKKIKKNQMESSTLREFDTVHKTVLIVVFHLKRQSRKSLFHGGAHLEIRGLFLGGSHTQGALISGRGGRQVPDKLSVFLKVQQGSVLQVQRKQT